MTGPTHSRHAGERRRCRTEKNDKIGHWPPAGFGHRVFVRCYNESALAVIKAHANGKCLCCVLLRVALALAKHAVWSLYQGILHWEIGPALPRIGQMTTHLWVADGLMAVFFLLVGLEVKREWFEGRLSTPETRRLPIIAALTGMGIPAFIFLIVTRFDPSLERGWAIPAATDIAFAIAVLAVLGRHAPASVKVLLVTIAIVDDIGAVLIIALAYSDASTDRPGAE